MERVTAGVVAQRVSLSLFAARKRTCSERHDVFPYRDTVTTRLLQISDCPGGVRMTNATGIRRPDELLHPDTADPAAGADQPGATRARNEELIAIAAREMDRLHEQIQEAGCALLLTDSNGAILHEKSNAVLQGRFRVHRVGLPVARMLAAEREVALPTLRAFQHSLTLEDLAGEDA